MAGNIEQLSREGLADRLTWNFGSETLPLAPIHKVMKEAARYAKEAKAGMADTLHDALTWNEDKTIKMVERLQQIDSSPCTSDAGFRDAFRRLMADLIERAAMEHAVRCDENGRL